MATVQEAAEDFAKKKLVFPDEFYGYNPEMKASFIAGAIWQEQQGWVAIEDRLPENGEVLGCMKDTLSIYVCYYKRTEGFLVWGLGREQPITDMKVTHWRPLPSPPGSTPVESKEAQEHDKTLNKLYDVQERLARKEDEIGDLVLELQELRARPSKEGKYREALEKIVKVYNSRRFDEEATAPMVIIATEALKP